MATFKVGDRVRCVKSYANSDTVGELGTIVARGTDQEMCGVVFDKFINGHSLRGRCKEGYGWWIPEGMLEKVRNDNDSKIIIMANGSTVTAKLVSGKISVAAATAKCSPEDDFNLLVGAQIALQRLAEQQNAKIVVNTKAFGKDIELI